MAHDFHTLRPVPPMTVRVLGSGTSMGVPVIGCECEVCRSDDPKNKRMRSSIAIEADGKYLLVDCSIDLRQQMLRWPMPRVDAVLLTHTHSDHVNGLDDLRSFNYLQRAPIPLYSTEVALDDLRLRFGYCFNPLQMGGGVPQLDLVPVQPGIAFEAGGVDVLPIEIMHGRLPILGFRIGRFAYLTDCSGVPPASEPLLQGLEVLIISGLRHTPHSTHFTVAESLAVARRLGVGRVYFTHVADELDHATTNAELPDGAELAYDGLLIEMGAAKTWLAGTSA